MKDSHTENTLDLQTDFPEDRYCLCCGAALHPRLLNEYQKCRLQYNPDNPLTYSVSPMRFSRLRWWLPGFCLSVLVGAISYALLAAVGEMSMAMFLAVPFAFGILLGFTVRPAKSILGLFVMGTVIVAATISVALLIFWSQFAGTFCGLTLMIVFLTPVVFGAVVGIMIRACLQGTRYGHWHYLPILLIIAFPFGVQAIENLFPHPVDIAAVHTEMVLPASAADSWNSLMFYEDVDHEPPWLLKLALPLPVRGEGVMGQVGDQRRCIYEKGYLTKQITERVEEHRLAFKVVEQHLHFERDVTLLGGSFELDPINDKQTRITLTTTYERHLSPAWLWKPIETKVVRTLHLHVLEGVRLKIRNLKENRQRPHEYEEPLVSNSAALLQTSVATVDD